MKIGNSVRITLGCLMCFAPIAVAHADDKADIQALVNKTQKAMEAKDVKGIMALATPDYTITRNGVISTATQVSTQLGQFFKGLPGNPKVKFTVLSSDVKGKMATVMSTNSMTLPSKPGADGVAHVIVASGKSKLILAKTAKGWLVKSEAVLSESMTVDGKQFTQPAPAKN